MQKKLLPKFGFQGEPSRLPPRVCQALEGAWPKWSTSVTGAQRLQPESRGRYSTDSSILELQTDINTKLGMDTKGRGLWRARA